MIARHALAVTPALRALLLAALREHLALIGSAARVQGQIGACEAISGLPLSRGGDAHDLYLLALDAQGSMLALRPLSDQARATLRAAARQPAWQLDQWFAQQIWYPLHDLTLRWPDAAVSVDNGSAQLPH